MLNFIFYDYYKKIANENIRKLGNVIGKNVFIIKNKLENQGYKVHIYIGNYITTYDYCIHIQCNKDNIILSNPYYQ